MNIIDRQYVLGLSIKPQAAIRFELDSDIANSVRKLIVWGSVHYQFDMDHKIIEWAFNPGEHRVYRYTNYKDQDEAGYLVSEFDWDGNLISTDMIN